MRKTMTVAGFRREVVRRRGARKRGAPRYDDALVSFAVSHARGVRAQGGSVLRAARDLGVSTMTLSKWMSREASVAAGVVREVVVSSPAALRSSSEIRSNVRANSGRRLGNLSQRSWRGVLHRL